MRSDECVDQKARRTYEPSGLRDSGMTRSSVRGSTAMPEAVVSGTIDGFDISGGLRRDSVRLECKVWRSGLNVQAVNKQRRRVRERAVEMEVVRCLRSYRIYKR